MKILLEMLRLIFLFAIIGGIFGYVLEEVYESIGSHPGKYSWMGFVAILILFFVLYRNKLQFSGWYKGVERKKLPNRLSRILISLSVVLILLPPILSKLL